MPKTTEILCDGCGADLTTTGNCEDFRLALLVQRIPSKGGWVTGMAAWPALERDAYFCGLKCLDSWRAESVEKTPSRIVNSTPDLTANPDRHGLGER